MTKTRTILIAGPTASGKSALALSLAEQLGAAVIINADSMQVYTDLRVLTARPTVEEEQRVRHALSGHISGRDAYSVARFVGECAAALTEAHGRGETALIVGGTGLYFKALLEGLSPIPPIPNELRAHIRTRALSEGATALHRELSARDPIMGARLVPTDTQRITRALEVLEATGQSLSHWQQIPGVPVIDPEQALRFVIELERGAMMARCDQRFDLIMRQGALEEVARLREAQLPADLPIMRALGVRPLIDYLEGVVTLERATELAKSETRQFAKRQITWLKRHMITWKHISTHESAQSSREIISFIDF